MPGEQTPLLQDQDRLRPVFTEPAYALRLIVEVDLGPHDNPTSQEAVTIVMDALGNAALHDAKAQIRRVTYEVDDQRLDGTLALPFPDESSRTPRRISGSNEVMTQPFGLTNREVEVLNLVAKGYTNTKIGRQLSRSADTVKTHLRRAYRKLHANDRAHAVCIFNGVVPQPQAKPRPSKTEERGKKGRIIK